MAGWPEAEASDMETNERILALGYESDEWDVASPLLHEPWSNTIGPRDWFAKTLIKELPAGRIK
jgi:hypothetical protein